MLSIAANKLRSSEISVTETVYVRVNFDTGYGVEDTQNPDNVFAWIRYKAWTKTEFEKNGINGKFFRIDNLNNEIIESIDKTKNYGWTEFNELFKNYMVETIEGLNPEDIEIIGL